MESTLNFGPQWLRTLSDSGSSNQSSSAPPIQPSSGYSHGVPQYRLAEHRYGREEMLALYTATSSIAPDLSDLSIMLTKPLGALSMEPMSEEEQVLLLSSVNSSLAMKTYGGRTGQPARGAGRGDYDRGRGRGRGRDDDGYGRRRDPWEDGYSRGGGKSYDRGMGYQNSSATTHNYDGGPAVGSHREFSRSMSTDNWREAKLSGPPPPDEERETLRGNGTHVRGLTRNWRETYDRRNNEYDTRSKQPPDGTAGKRIDFKRSLSSNSTQDEESRGALPEWSTVDADEIEDSGSFDASGAFLFSKDSAGMKKSLDADDGGKKLSVGVVGSEKNSFNDSSTAKGARFDIEPSRRVQNESGGGVSGEKTHRSNDSIEKGLASLSLAADPAPPFSRGSSRTVEQTSGFKNPHILSNGPFSSSNDFSHSLGNSIVPVSSSSTSLFDTSSSSSSETKMKKEAEKFVAQWTGGDDSRQPVPPKHHETSHGVAPILPVDHWFYRDPQGDIQGDLIKLCGEVPFASKSSAMPFASKLSSGLPLAVNSVPVSAMPAGVVQAAVDPAFGVMMDPVKLKMLQEQQMQLQQLILSQQMQYLHAQQQFAAAAAASGSLPGQDAVMNPGLSLASVIGGPGMFGHMMQPNLLGNSVRPGATLGLSSMSDVAATGSSLVNDTNAKAANSWGAAREQAAAREKAEQERLERERADRERAEQERAEKERLQLERERAEQAEREKAEHMRLEKERLENERLTRERIEAEKQQQEWKRLQEVKQKIEEDRRQQEQHEEEQRRRHQDQERLRQEEERQRQKKKEGERILQEQQHWLRIEEQIKREAAAADERREKKQVEEAKMKQMKAAPAPWSNVSQHEASMSSNLEQIQRMEAEQQRQQQEEIKRHKMMEYQMQQQMQQQSLTWKERMQLQTPPAPSLLEIQQEQERQLREEKTQHSYQAKSVVPENTFSATSLWSSTPVFGNSSIWDNVDAGTRIKVPATPLNSAAQFPALPTAAKKSSQSKSNKSASNKSQKDEATVQKLFEANKTKDELTQWCETVLHGLETSADIPTLVEFLKDIESPYEVHDYIKSYLGESKQVSTFAQQFLEKRSKIKNASKPKQEDSLWGPAPALNPQLSRQQQTAAKQQHVKQQSSNDKGKASAPAAVAAITSAGGAKKKKKMLKVDSSILGFTVHADSERTNMGEIDRL